MNETSRFEFTRYEEDFSRGTVDFYYELTHLGQVHSFVEKLVFTPPTREISQELHTILRALFETIHLALGVSYWKLFCPKVITVPYALAQPKVEFWDTFYQKGLGEFFYRNKIDYRGLVHFTPSPNKQNSQVILQTLSTRSLVLLGAGKDSIVTAESFKKDQKEYSLFTVNPSPIHKEVARLIGASLVEMKRIIDPKLSLLNKQAGAFNGHIPITAITSMLGILAALLYDFGSVVTSNEKSANIGNVQYLGEEINHQWSKSDEFEQLFQQYLTTYITPSIAYFSFLRSFSELEIAEKFTKYPQYFDAFTSCNKNFQLHGNPLKGQWCGKCSKCAFVFLLLAAFLPKDKVVSIFGKNLFADLDLVTTYEELLGFVGFKPFECVGTPEESKIALARVLEKGAYASDVVIQKLYAHH